MAKNLAKISSVLQQAFLKQSFSTSSFRHLSVSTSHNNSHKWKLGKLNHVAIAVNDLDASIKMYRDVLGAKVSEPAPQEAHGVYTVFVELGDTKIELLYPLGENSPIAGFLKKNPSGGIHHVCLEVSDVYKAMETMKEKGIRVLDKQPKIGAHGKPVVFLHPKDCGGVLTELEQE